MDRKLVNLISVGLISVTLAIATQNAYAANQTLWAAKATTAPKLDGLGTDAIWKKAKSITVPVSGGLNLPPNGKTKVTMKAVYTDKMIYFLAQYRDPTRSLMRTPWQKQADGSWKRLKTPSDPIKNPDGIDESRYHEDKFALMWNISTPSFAKEGCMAACHLGVSGKDYGVKYTPKANQLLDMWYLRSIRTVPLGQASDDVIDGTPYDKDKSPNGGRKSDPNTNAGSTSKNNETEDKSMPLYALPGNKPAPPFWILDSKKVPFDNSKYKVGDKVPSIVLIEPWKGDRGDISAKMTWKGGIWTCEIARKRITDSKLDIQFKSLTKAYNFGVAVADNVDHHHSYSAGSEILKFEQ